MIITNETYLSISEKLKSNLKPSRYEHSLGVAMTASCLAMRYGADINEARLSGLLHDCAKNMSDEEMFNYCSKNNIFLSEEQKTSTQVLHAVIGPYIANEKYGISDKNVLEAIRYHSTGKPDMSLLEMIIFTADYIEPNRKIIPGLFEIRKEAFVDLNKCVYMILSDTIKYLKDTDREIVTDTLKAYDFYKERLKND